VSKNPLHSVSKKLLNVCRYGLHFHVYVGSVLAGLQKFCGPLATEESRDSSVGVALGYGLDVRGSRARFLAEAGNFSLHHRAQNGSGVHPASYPMGTGSSFLGGKASWREADHLPPSSAEVKECVELYLHSPSTSSWRGA
jgi:hypothetical protein